MRFRSPRVLVAVLATVVATGLIAGCGGDDEPAAQQTATVTEQVTVTVPGAVTAPEAPADGGADPSGETTTLSAEEVETAVQAYQGFFGFTEEQARCVVEEAQRLQALDADDPTAFLASGGLELFSKCGIDIEDIVAKFGGLPE